MLATGWDLSWNVSQNTYVWPPRVAWASSHYGSLRVVGLPVLHLISKGMCPNEQGRSYIAFYDLASEVTHNHFCIRLVTSKSQVCVY